MRFIELFAGVGGFRYGLEKTTGYQCVYANEWDKYAASIYRYHWNDGTLHECDIRTVDPVELPGHDLIVGGFPCQAFSIAGKRAGFTDTRGALFFEICRIARTCRTKYLLLENVKGLLNHEGGATFLTIISTLDELGYDYQWHVLNSKNFGVPQNRERVFIIANLRTASRPQIFPLRNSNETDKRDGDEEFTIANCLGANYSKGTAGNNARTLVHTAFQDGVREYSDISTTISTPSGGGHLPMVQVNTSLRRLTPVECERLQAFPDNWTQYGISIHGEQVKISDTQRYKTMGNAVTTSVVTAIAMAINEAIGV
jgi:DNA (cytosine-5)-methyltransferase 1